MAFGTSVPVRHSSPMLWVLKAEAFGAQSSEHLATAGQLRLFISYHLLTLKLIRPGCGLRISKTASVPTWLAIGGKTRHGMAGTGVRHWEDTPGLASLGKRLFFASGGAKHRGGGGTSASATTSASSSCTQGHLLEFLNLQGHLSSSAGPSQPAATAAPKQAAAPKPGKGSAVHTPKKEIDPEVQELISRHQEEAKKSGNRCEFNQKMLDAKETARQLHEAQLASGLLQAKVEMEKREAANFEAFQLSLPKDG